MNSTCYLLTLGRRGPHFLGERSRLDVGKDDHHGSDSDSCQTALGPPPRPAQQSSKRGRAMAMPAPKFSGFRNILYAGLGIETAGMRTWFPLIRNFVALQCILRRHLCSWASKFWAHSRSPCSPHGKVWVLSQKRCAEDAGKGGPVVWAAGQVGWLP